MLAIIHIMSLRYSRRSVDSWVKCFAEADLVTYLLSLNIY